MYLSGKAKLLETMVEVLKSIVKILITKFIIKIAFILVTINNTKIDKIKTGFLTILTTNVWLKNSPFNCSFNKLLNLGFGFINGSFY